MSGIWPPAVGGPASHAPELGDFLARRGHSVRAVAVVGPEAQRAAFPLVRIDPGGGRAARLARGLRVISREVRRADVVYATELYHRTVAAARLSRVPIVLKLVNDPAYERSRSFGLFAGTLEEFQGKLADPRVVALKRARSAAARAASHIVVPSHYLGRIATRWIDGSDVTIDVIPNPAPAAIPTESRDQLRLELGLVAPTAVFAGRMVAQKNLALLVAAAAAVEGLDVVLIGEGPEAEIAARSAADLQIGDRVRILASMPRAEALRWVKAADAAVLASDWENHPHAVVEALRVGTPVVATAVGGVPEIVEDGVTGALVPPRDVDALASALRSVVLDGEHNARLRRAIADRASRTDPDGPYDRVEALLTGLARRQRPAATP